MTDDGDWWPGKQYGWLDPVVNAEILHAREVAARGYTPAAGELGYERPADPPEGEDTTEPYAGRLVAGDVFVLDEPEHPEPVWGDGSEVLWSRGEPCLITGPIGAGKTTLMARLVHASLGMSPEVLGWPVAPADRVLYLACDRPRQIARNMSRMFHEADRDNLHDRLVVWPGPPPADLARNPGMLGYLVEAARATRLFIDGVKDVAAKISDEETGQGLNAEFQRLMVAGIDVVANHHQRKHAGLHKPKTLDDLYGSVWLAAGAGTVILCWADEAGAQSIELSTLKAAADGIGPLDILHDLDKGTLTRDDTPSEGPQWITKANVQAVLVASAQTKMTAAEIAGALGHDPKNKDKRTAVKRVIDRNFGPHLVHVDEVADAGSPGSPTHYFRWIGEGGRTWGQ